ncbi:MAG: hypothetical protein KA169_04795, partial [Burkholderiaceae bacterium]|nr:hypothetical protein [Burkholderiaceae bacterium]
MSSGLYFTSGPGHVLASLVRLESWRLCTWFDQPATEPRHEFTDRDALDTWLRQFDPARLREVAGALAEDFTQSPR